MSRELRRIEVPCAGSGIALHPTHMAIVYALVEGALAVHRGLGKTGGSWVITHVPTGRVLPLRYDEETQAIEALEILLQAGNWDEADYDTIRANSTLKEAVRTLAAAS